MPEKKPYYCIAQPMERTLIDSIRSKIPDPIRPKSARRTLELAAQYAEFELSKGSKRFMDWINATTATPRTEAECRDA